MNLSTPVEQLNRVGKTTAKRLERVGVKTACDLLFYFPFRYEDFRRIVLIKDLSHGDNITVRGTIELLANKRSPRQRKNITEAIVSDASGSVRVVWFNQPFITKLLKPGDIVYLSGRVQADMLGPQLVSPVYEKETNNNTQATTHTARLVPMYPLTAGITQKQIRFLVSQIIGLSEQLNEWIPSAIISRYNYLSLSKAIKGVHFPDSDEELRRSTERLKFDELFVLQLKAELSRLEKSHSRATALDFQEEKIKNFVAKLPFVLTKTQKISAWEILQDIAKPVPMNRLLSGDVGSGKTVVSAIAMYNAILNDYQAVLMAPTEILARQHFDSLCKLFDGIKINIGLLTRTQASKFQIPISPARRRDPAFGRDNFQFSKHKKILLNDIKKRDIDIIIGTHALLAEAVEFNKLGLVIVDEQHRFGVEQRKMIKDKTSSEKIPHFLSMTATPIPRSLALTLYGDLDVSIINELPPGRKKILTRLVEPINRAKAYEFIRSQVKNGRQAFVVCPLIEIKGSVVALGQQYQISADKKTVLAEFDKLSKTMFPDLKVAYLHGKLKGKEKEEIMTSYKNKEIDILISTSVIEVGVDIPNASVMMVEDAERFGLAQLHQFRGRVGRSSHQSYCFLFVGQESRTAMERLKYFEKTDDGFKLAEKDLAMRGPGEVYGTMQSGMMNLRLAKLTDQEIIKKAREAAKMIVPEIDKYPLLKNKMKEWEEAVHLE